MKKYNYTSAIFDETKKYRYSLVRDWGGELLSTSKRCAFVLLNGSTADAENDDPTLRRCVYFAKREGCTSLEIVNLFGFRTTLPSELFKANSPVGDSNDEYILYAVKTAQLIIVGWGVHGKFKNRDKAVLPLLNGCPLFCFGLTNGGHPRHPLYLANTAKLVLYPPTSGGLKR